MDLEPTIENNALYNSFFIKFITKDFLKDLLNVLLYQSDISAIVSFKKTNEVYKHLIKFLGSIQKELRKITGLQLSQKNVNTVIEVTRKVIDIKQNVSFKVLTYDTVNQHFPNSELHIRSLFDEVSENRIQNSEEFRKKFEELFDIINMYFEFQIAKNVTYQWSQLIADSEKDNIPPVEFLKRFKENTLESYNTLSDISVFNKDDKLEDYIVFSDKDSCKSAAKQLLRFLEFSYDYYKSGYDILDKNISGIESSSFHLISGPTNAAKSIFMLNLERQIILSNDWNQKDTIVHITLEDNAYKLSRRLSSIFGNVDSKMIKEVYTKCSELKKEETKKEGHNSSYITQLETFLSDLIQDSIVTITDNRATFVLKHSVENSFSCNDLTKILDSLKMQGYNIKILFVDYLDLLIPSTQRYTSYDDYAVQGQVVHELRSLALNYSVPVVTITQNARSSENMQQVLNNAQLGDSYKKARFSDYIYMVRLRRDLDLLHEQVKNDVFGENQDIQLQDLSNFSNVTLIPFEVTITKAKDGERDKTKMHVFNSQNLRIYQSMPELSKDIIKCQKLSEKIVDKINVLGIKDINFLEDDNIDNLLL